LTDGSEYVWDRDPNPWDISDMSDELWERYCRALSERLVRVAGCTIVKDGLGGAVLSAAVKREAEALLAPEPEDALRALMAWKASDPAAHETYHMPHDLFVQLCAAFRGAVGDEADALYADFCECLPGDRPTDGNTYKTYHSFDSGVNLGWSRLCEITGFIP